MKVNKQLDVQIPHVPNFILESCLENTPHPIDSFTDAELRKIGKAWTEELVKKSQKKREMEL